MGQEASGGAWWCVEVGGIRLGKGDSRSLSRLKSVSGLACSLVCTFHVALKNKKRTGMFEARLSSGGLSVGWCCRRTQTCGEN